MVVYKYGKLILQFRKRGGRHAIMNAALQLKKYNETSKIQAKQLIVDLYGCDAALLDDVASIRDAIHRACESIGAGIVEECYHKFTPIGVSAVAVITTSHISIHTWPEYGYAAVDIFSCREDIPGEVSGLLSCLLKARQSKARMIKRKLCRGKEDMNGTLA